MNKIYLSLVFLGVLVWVAPAQPASLTLNVSQDVYQVEEHGNVTLTWTFPLQINSPPDSLLIDVAHLNPLKQIYLYDSKRKVEPYIDVAFRGRLQCDADLDRTGQVHCVLTHLRLNDSGTYQCVVVVDQHKGHKSCDLKVTAAAAPPDETPDLDPDPDPDPDPGPKGRGRPGLFAVLVFAVVIIILGLWCYSRYKCTTSAL